MPATVYQSLAAVSGLQRGRTNQVERAFNGLGQMTTEWQSHSGAVNTSTSSKVQYAYAEMPSGGRFRLTSITGGQHSSIAFLLQEPFHTISHIESEMHKSKRFHATNGPSRKNLHVVKFP